MPETCGMQSYTGGNWHGEDPQRIYTRKGPKRLGTGILMPKQGQDEGCGGIGTLVHCWWECEMVEPFCNTVWQFFNILNVELPHDAAIPLLGICPREMKTYVHVKNYVWS